MKGPSPQTILQLGAIVLLLAALAGGAMILDTAGAASDPKVVQQLPANTLPATTCTLVGKTRSCDLYAKTGSLALPNGVTVTIWGYAKTGNGSPQVPGPTIIANQGETLSVTIHNALAETTSLDFPGQNVVPDTIGAAPGTAKTYTFTVANPGTTIFQAGPTIGAGQNGVAGGTRQIAMGLAGALVVRPTGCVNCAYDSNSTFDDEALVVVHEIDPAFNAAPLTYDFHTYNPKYWLINGKTYPQTDPISTGAGRRVLLRYLNAGLQDHSMGILGMHQTVLANDGKPLQFPYQVVAETMSAGESIDMIATVPSSAPSGSKFAIFNTAMHLDNNGVTNPDGTITFGGMLTFLTIAGTGGSPTPLTTNVNVVPSPTNGSVAVSLTATISASSGTIAAAEYFIDNVGTDGTGVPMTGPFGTLSVDVSATISKATLAGLSSGNHGFFVHGKGSNGKWGAVSSAVLNLDKTGPVTTSISLSKSPTNGKVDDDLSATADDSKTGGSNVDRAEYFIDTPGANGAGEPMTLNQPGMPITGLTATLPAATIADLVEGTHSLFLHSHDVLGNWGAFATITLLVDKTGPTTSGEVIQVTPNNGTIPLNSNTFVVQTNVSINDPISGGIQSNVVAAEGFLDTIGKSGTGTQLLPGTGSNFNSPSVTAYMQIALYSIQALPEGPHTIYVHGLDQAGNWGPYAFGTLVIDKTGPAVSNVVATPNPTKGATTVTLTASATDPVVPGMSSGSNIVGAEWFDGPDPGAGQGKAMAAADGTFDNPTEALTTTIDITTWKPGKHQLSVRALDAAGNWGTASIIVLSDTNAPIISSVSATGITNSAATIVWTTDMPSSSQVNYGTTPAYGLVTTLDPKLVTSHSVGLTGLSSKTTYHYQVSSKAGGQTSKSGDYTFTTQ